MVIRRPFFSEPAGTLMVIRDTRDESCAASVDAFFSVGRSPAARAWSATALSSVHAVAILPSFW